MKLYCCLLIVLVIAVSPSCKKQINKEEDSTIFSNVSLQNLPDSLFVGGGIIGKWKLTKAKGGMNAIGNYDFYRDNIFLGVMNNGSIIRLGDKEVPAEVDFPFGTYNYVFKILRPVNYNYGNFKDYGELTIGNKKFGCYTSDSTLMLIQDYDMPFLYFNKNI